MPNRYDICIRRGFPYVSSITVKDKNGTPLDLAQYNLSGELKSNWDGEVLAQFNLDKQSPFVSGRVMASLPVSVTSPLPITEGVFTISAEATGDAQDRLKVLYGYAQIYP